MNIVLLVGLRAVALPGGSGELRFGLPETKTFSYAALILIFLLNSLVFVPLGEQIGAQFQRLPALRAYVWDLAGSLGGTLTFGLFSFLHISPVIGIALVVALVFLAAGGAHRRWTLPLYAVGLGAVAWSSQRDQTWWSPYYFITIRENRVHLESQPDNRPTTGWFTEETAGLPPANLRTVLDPPLYNVRVNQDFYQRHGSINVARYTPGSALQQLVAAHFNQYDLPYHVVKNPARVLVLGAGGGMDVEAALLRGAQRVDAIEIDPVIPKISARYSAAAPYADPRVFLHIDDARSFLQQGSGRFDLVVFGHLDSQALFSYGASLRLDGYTYTVEGFRQAFARVAPEGIMSVSFSVSREWLAQKFSQMIEEATGTPPWVYVGKGTLTFIASKQATPNPPAEIGEWKLRRATKRPVDLATDDWPFVYLEKRGIPTDYAVVIGALLTISLGALLGFRGAGFGPGDGHFLLLGWGFLLLQTKSIGDCSLYFGTTWLVTTLVIAGVLLMVLLANWVALRFIRQFNLWLYAPLFVALVVVLALPREFILARELGWRVAWTVFVVPLPIFFAGLIFSTTFREDRVPALALGANLIGATLGGFCEYLGMWVGSQALGGLVIAAYAGSLLCLLRQRRSPLNASATGEAAGRGHLPSPPAP
ncbi:MAG: hypothetical protein EXS43_01735 [Opitutus sp.]|nr:hypothetical protein [Opitutus sp.]